MKIKVFLICALLLSACHHSENNADIPSSDVVGQFRSVCVQNSGNHKLIADFARQNKWRLLPEHETAGLPVGLVEPDLVQLWEAESGKVYLSLTKNSCNIKAIHADTAEIWRQFEQLAANAPKGLNVELRADRFVKQPFALQQKSYAWRADGSPEEILLTATTAESPEFPVQAVLTLTRHSYSGTLILP